MHTSVHHTTRWIWRICLLYVIPIRNSLLLANRNRLPQWWNPSRCRCVLMARNVSACEECLFGCLFSSNFPAMFDRPTSERYWSRALSLSTVWMPTEPVGCVLTPHSDNHQSTSGDCLPHSHLRRWITEIVSPVYNNGRRAWNCLFYDHWVIYSKESIVHELERSTHQNIVQAMKILTGEGPLIM